MRGKSSKKVHRKWSEKSMAGKIITVVLIVLLLILLWIIFDVLRGVFSKDAPRKPGNAGDKSNYSYSGIQIAVWLIEHPDKENGYVYYAKTEEPNDSLFAYTGYPTATTHEMLTEEKLLEFIKPAADFMAKRYDCSDFRAIWLCKLRYALANSSEYNFLLTERVDNAIRDALTGFKYWITSDGADSMCYYSENHQTVFAVSEYYAGLAYPNDIFAIDGKPGAEHARIAENRLNNWFDQRARYGFSEFLSSNYLAVDIGALSMLRTYCTDRNLSEKAKLALDMLFLDYSLQMYNCTMSAPAGRNYARNNTNFNASYGSLAMIDKIWHTGKTDIENIYSGFPYLFISLIDSGKYSVPEAIIEIGRDNNKGVVKTTSGQTLKEMQKNNLIGLSDYCLQFQLGMGALSNEEVIDNTLSALNKYDLVHNNFVSSFKYFNITFLRLLGLTGKISKALDPFSNGMAIQRNEVYTYCTKDYKLSTNQLYFPGSYGAQQIQQIACLPGDINIFTTNPMRSKEFQGYGVAPAAAQNENVMLMIHRIPQKKPLLATGDVRHYTSTYFPEEKFDEVTVNKNYVFGRKNNSYIALIGASPLSFVSYSDEADFEKKISDTYEFYEGDVGPAIDSFRLTDRTKGFDLRQNGDLQFTIYELGSSDNESFEAFIKRVSNNSISFANDTLTYVTKDTKGNDVTYVLTYPEDTKNAAGSCTFTVNGTPVNTEHDRYDSAYVRTLRTDDVISIKYGNKSHEIDLKKMMQ